MKYRLGDLCTFEKGITGIQKATPGEYPLVVTGLDRKSSDSFQFDCEAVCIPLVSSTGHGHKSLNYVHYQSGKFALGTILVALIVKDNKLLDTEYLREYLFLYKDEILVPLMKGGANVTLSLKSLQELVIELPSIDKQLKVVENIKKVKEQIENLVIDNNSCKEKVDELKASVLDCAFRGKLSFQSLDDEPVNKLIEKIKKEKDILISEGKIKKEQTYPPISPEEYPFEIPNGWVWVRLGEIGITSIGLTYSPTDISDIGIPVLRSNNIQNGKINLNGLVRVNKEVRDRLKIEIGDIVICARNGSKSLVGKAALVEELNEDMTFGAFMAIYRSKCNAYIVNFINSRYFKKLISDVNSTAINQLTQNNLKNTLMPLPPLAEQERINKKVSSIMTICDEQMSNIEIMKKNINQLSQSVLKELLK